MNACLLLKAPGKSENSDDQGILFDHQFDNTGVRLLGDMDRIAQIIDNLLTNAVKFTEPGGTISLSLKAEGEFAIVRVSDTGCGISSEVGKHIFEKFYQGDTSRATEGNGLGLALVLRVLQLMNASIQVDSAEGQGTIFTVRIPTNQNRKENR